MSLLAECAPSRWTDFLNIDADRALLIVSDEGVDFFIGKNKTITMQIANKPGESEVKFRDIVVLGKLIINCSNPENTAIKAKLIARDIFAPSHLYMKSVDIKCDRFYQPKNNETFRRELQELFLEWLSIQRDSVDKIGLKSILV